ncbi:MAG TPA: M28 family peptidase [Flavobacteriaceae bacterium]|nr:M28 family peptidase [Flavobacteriaceae bacterium]
MKVYLLIPFLAICLSCKGQSTVTKPIDLDVTIEESLNYLSGDALLGRDTGSEGIELAAQYMEGKFQEWGVKPYFETYRDTFDAKGKNGFNIVGVVEGHDDMLKNEVVILGAHYDHIGKGRMVENDSIANGANDNASGTSIVLAMAEHFAKTKSNKRTLLFVLFSAEEMGLLGSAHIAERLKEKNINLYTMVNFEMLGVPFKDRDYEVFLTGFEMSNMAEKMNAYAGSNLVGFSEVSKQYSLFKRSDNYAFYKAFNLPCHTISSCDLSNFDYYHHVDDEVDKLDVSFMKSVTKKLIPVIESVSNTATKEITLNEE